MQFEQIVLIRDKTRLEQLIERFNSKAQAKFYLEMSGGDYNYIENEHETFYNSLKSVEKTISTFLKFKVVQRSFLSTYIFVESDLIIVLGQDGLVANTAKYAKDLPIIAVNPDPEKYDGVLLPFNVDSLLNGLNNTLNGKYQSRNITMAKAELNDGQSLLAFNDFFIGNKSHVSARYELDYKDKIEKQSSSGIIVSTGAGSTGWLSSVFNMANNINKFAGTEVKDQNMTLDWEEDRLVFVVREPFLSKASNIDIGLGIISKGESLKIKSNMPTKGVIFSDGIESDFLKFNSGSAVEISIAKEKARLVVN